MHSFELIRATDVAQAIEGAAQNSKEQQVRFVAGGTTLIDLMKLNVENPQRVIDINGLPLNKVEFLPDGGLKIGAVVRNSDLAYHVAVIRDYPVLSQALLSGVDVMFLDYPDLVLNEYGARGVGEIGLAGGCGRACLCCLPRIRSSCP